jgi:hypothetical protein
VFLVKQRQEHYYQNELYGPNFVVTAPNLRRFLFHFGKTARLSDIGIGSNCEALKHTLHVISSVVRHDTFGTPPEVPLLGLSQYYAAMFENSLRQTCSKKCEVDELHQKKINLNLFICYWIMACNTGHLVLPLLDPRH